MTVTTPTPERPEDKAVLDEALNIVENAQDDLTLQKYFSVTVKVGQYLVLWRKMMRDGGFSDSWIDEAAMDLFNHFFPPFVPPLPNYLKDDDD